MATKQKQTEDKKVKYRTEEKDKKKKKNKHMNPIFFELPSLAHGGRRRVYYLSVAAASFLVFIIALEAVKYILFSANLNFVTRGNFTLYENKAMESAE